MIQAKELRIDSLLNYCGNIVEVIGFFEDTVFIKNGRSAGIHIENLEPIPLTEQWLIDFGFEKDWVFEKDGIETRTNDGVNWICWINSNYLLDIQSVHQLQNLYFALTGKELTKQKTP